MTKLDMSLIMCFVFNMYFENKNDGIFQTKSNEIGLFRVRNNFPLMLRWEQACDYGSAVVANSDACHCKPCIADSHIAL